MVADPRSKESDKLNQPRLPESGIPTPEPTFEQLRDRLSEIEGVEESVAEFIARNWQRVAIGFGCVLLLVWLVNQIQQSEQTKEERASALFSTAQQAYGSFRTISSEQTPSEGIAGEQMERAKIVFSENVKALSDDKTGIYSTFAKLYNARFLLDNSDIDAARTILNDLGATKLLNSAGTAKKSAALDDIRIAQELAALLYAKSFILTDIAEAQALLIKLSAVSILVVEEALTSLVRIVQGQSQIEQAVSAAKVAIANNPHLADAIERAYQEQGITIYEVQ